MISIFQDIDYKPKEEYSISLSSNQSFIFDKCFHANFDVIKQMNAHGVVHYSRVKSLQKTEKSLIPIITFPYVNAVPVNSEECISYYSESFKLTLVFKPPRKLLKN